MTFIRALERPGLYIAISLGRLFLGLVLNVIFVVYLRWGVMVARRAWLQAGDVLNTQSFNDFRASLRRHRRPHS